jgi:PRA1 family protein 1
LDHEDEYWELRQAQQQRFSERFEDLGSEDEGVSLDPHGFASRDAVLRQQRTAEDNAFVSDELYFDGYDLGQDRQHARRSVYDMAEYEEYDSEEQAFNGRSTSMGEEALIRSALERIRQARAQGKTNVSLTSEEMEALERRQGLASPAPAPAPAAALVSPPATPAKTSKAKTNGSRSSSSTSLAGQKNRKKASYSSPAKSNSKAKVDRKPSAEQAPSYPPGAGIMVPGPNGVPVFAPLVNYPPPGPETSRSGAARPSSRSSSKHSRRESTPPERTEAYAQFPPRYYAAPAGMRPPSSSSNRSFQDDLDWYPPPGRNRSASNVPYMRPGEDYDPPVLPAAQGRRNVSGSADIRYSTLRRVPPSSSPLAPRPNAQHANSDPLAAGSRKNGMIGSKLERTSTGSSSSSSDDQGVQVNIVPDASGGYLINRAPLATAATTAAAPSASGNETKKRKGARR